eukprot:gene12117-14175_t
MSEITNSLSNTHTCTDTSITNEEVSETGEDYDPFLSILEEPIGENGAGIEKETTEELQEMLAVLKGVQNECNVLLLGRTGVGKSSTLNTVFGIDIPVHSSESCTQEPFTYSRNVNGFKLNIIDTPGFLDSQGDAVDAANMLKIQRYLSGKTIHCVLFVEKFTETRFDGAHQLVINQFTEKLGPQLWRNAAVVLTYANSVLPDSCYDGFEEDDDIGPWKKHLDSRSTQFKRFFSNIFAQLPQDDFPPKNIPIYAMENSRRCARNEAGQRILVDGTPCLHLLISGLLRMVDPKTAFLFMGHLRAKNKPGKSHRGDQQDRERSIFENLTEILKLFIVPPFDQLGKGTVAKILEGWGKKLDRYVQHRPQSKALFLSQSPPPLSFSNSYIFVNASSLWLAGKLFPAWQRENLVSDPISGYFQNLQSPDVNIRKAAIENILQILSNPENEKLLRSNINTIVVLATESPFDEITEAFSNLLDQVQTTTFINETQLPPLNTNDELTKRLFQEVFLQSGRVNHIVRLLGWHPQYMERFLASYNKVMRDPGPLPLAWRNYIGIMSAARYNCSYLVSLQEHEFLHNAGDPKWLQGIDFVPQKLKNLLRIVQLMAHQPWLLQTLDIEYLVKGSDAWSIAELVHAMILICTFLSLSGFVFSCGIVPEYGLASEEKPPYTLNDSDCEVEDTTASEATIKVMELLKKRRDEQSEDDEDEEHDRQQEFHNAGIEPDSDDYSDNDTSTSDEPGGPIDMARYIGTFAMSHTDFDVSSRDYTIFSVQDYSWKEHGYELVSRIFPDAAPLLDEEFSFVYTMTYYRFNNSTDIDTLPFRRAVWYYVQRVKGMCHDDYNYQEVNMFLSRNLKYYVKKAVCFPDNISKVDYSKLGYDLKPDEKCHLALLAE